LEDSKKFKEDIVWNFISLIVLALSGIVLNILIGVLYDAATLGVFNQVLATYIFFSMFAVGGINLSALKLLAEDHHNKSRNHEVIWSAVLLTTLSSALFVTIYCYIRELVAHLLNSPNVAVGMTWIAPGLFFFGVNKTILSSINALQKMKAFAVFQGLRYANLLTGFLIAVSLGFPGEQLSFVFSFSEITLFLIMLGYMREFWAKPLGNNWLSFLPYHLKFGTKGALSGALLELNSRVDVLMLGYFLTDKVTGIYSFAAMLYEGFMQFLVVLQNNYNPHLSNFLHNKKWEALVEAIKKGRNLTYKYALVLVPLTIACYPIGISIVFGSGSEFAASWQPFLILMIGLLISAGYLPFQHLLVMGGLPGWHTFFMIITVVFNILFNWVLIPIYGLNGAAMGTALSLTLSSITLLVLTKQKLKLSLI
jgi:O-antigen/teichoic acid export membrane protein